LKEDITTTDLLSTSSIVLFDGVCNLCVGSVQFIMKRDSKRIFRFAALQSDTGKQLLATFGIDASELTSFYCIRQGTCLQQSDAALYIAQQLDGYWWILGALRWVPRKLRDALYNAVGSQRYRLFGKRAACLVPDNDVLDRFIQD